jgi:hypothetical protein
MFESKDAPLLSARDFYVRLARCFAVMLVILCFSLALGTVGYHHFGKLAWIDALENAAMILTGMGPVTPMTTDGGKLFATFYALYSGVAFLTSVAVLAAPVVHRFMHKFHMDVEEE